MPFDIPLFCEWDILCAILGQIAVVVELTFSQPVFVWGQAMKGPFRCSAVCLPIFIASCFIAMSIAEIVAFIA
ncbi:hypothetical protein AVM02_08470 [Brucella anthropi]